MMKIFITNLDGLQNTAKELVKYFGNKHIIAFFGAMGAGKTTLIRAICKELGVIENVASPTFSLVNEYKTQTGKKIYHFDFYRISKVSEVYDFGYEEYFYSDELCFIEWPEVIEELLPDDFLSIRISVLEDETRKLSVGYPIM